MKRHYITPKEAVFALRTCADALEQFGDDNLTAAKLVERVFDFIFATLGDDAMPFASEIERSVFNNRGRNVKETPQKPKSCEHGDAIADIDAGLDSILDRVRWDVGIYDDEEDNGGDE